MGVPRGCGPGSKAPIRCSVSCQRGVSSVGFFSLLTFGPLRIIITSFLEAKTRILVIDPDVVSVLCPAYNRNLRRFGSFTERSTFAPGIVEIERFAYFLYDSQTICIIPLSSNSVWNPNETCPDSICEFHHRTECPQSQGSGWERGRSST